MEFVITIFSGIVSVGMWIIYKFLTNKNQYKLDGKKLIDLLKDRTLIVIVLCTLYYLLMLAIR